MKLQLPDVTLIVCDCVNAQRAVNVIEHSKSLCDFGDVKLLTSIPISYKHRVKIMPLNTLIAYSIFMLKEVHKYVETSHMLISQRDGWILNPQSWDNSWMQRDYLAPLFVQYPKIGSGGFSLRSKKLMEEVSRQTPEWDGTQKNADEIQAQMGMYEDGVISLSGKFSEFSFGTLEEGANFCQGGNPDPLYYRPHAFGFHGVHQNIQHDTGFISPVCEHHLLDCDCNKDHVNHLQKIAEEIVK